MPGVLSAARRRHSRHGTQLAARRSRRAMTAPGSCPRPDAAAHRDCPGTGLAAGLPDRDLAQAQRVTPRGSGRCTRPRTRQRPPLRSENAGPASTSAADVVMVVMGTSRAGPRPAPSRQPTTTTPYGDQQRLPQVTTAERVTRPERPDRHWSSWPACCGGDGPATRGRRSLPGCRERGRRR